jgi:hypothetical protein
MQQYNSSLGLCTNISGTVYKYVASYLCFYSVVDDKDRTPEKKRSRVEQSLAQESE